MKHWKSLVTASALALSTLVGVANAQQPTKERGDHHLQFMATALDLTDAQVAQIKQIQSESKTSSQADRQQMKSLHQQLHALVTSESFDEGKASVLITQIHQQEASRMLEQAKEMNAIYKVLTPTQKTKAVKLFGASMHDGGMHGHGGPGPDGPPAPAQD
ncbi:protein of unknown function, Spy-related protein [Candidatus Koribacter versatilis Ellin345]|uniref:Periplasmic heavy metal sensor n=1 Tax=Koribacter versatilis (strain Ellin345) TaxID=204669 RepID=Q1II41_KORVE|nr:Spy/CpxP family protein refolding chaperone [Candidatus Koribacter versatilis]ABF43459.1 protein of unknown function, Spy-related protein [Candidatus Koribacter versatilis Ellin345]